MTTLIAQSAGLFTHGALAAAGAAAMSIPIIIHLLTRMRRKPQRWGAMKFLIEAYRRQRTRLRLEQWLLLLVRCLILLMLGLALAGPLLGGFARNIGLSTGGRVIYFVIDDSLSESATDTEISTGNATGNASGNTTRFERQRKLALSLLDGLTDSDKVAVYLASRPAEPLVAAPTLDRSGVRRQLTQLAPRMGKADLVTALRDVRVDLDKQNVQPDHAFVIVLSDFAPDAAAIDQTLPEDLKAFDQHARLLLTNPTTASTNIQISALNPTRHLIITRAYGNADGSIRLPISVQLNRFADDNQSRVSNIELALIGDDPKQPLHVFAKETFRWPSGEQSATLRRNLVVPGDVIASLDIDNLQGASSGASLVLRASIEPDALEADNTRSTVIELRRQVRVGIIGDNAANFGREDKELSPDRWLSIALAPIEEAPAEVRHLPAIDLDEQKLAPLDAAMITRPDLVSEAGWRGLRKMLDRGGLVWIFAPHVNEASPWGDALRKHFAVTWDVAIDPIALVDENDPRALGKPLSLDIATPDTLKALSTNWKALLAPIRIKRQLKITTTAGADQVWLAGDNDQPLLLSEQVGRGRLMLLGTSLDGGWSNLPTKPLFTPLLHETLQSAVANAGDASRLSQVIVGDVPALSKTWDGAAQLKRLGTSDQAAGILLRRTDDGYEPVDPLKQAGIYHASPQTQGRLIAVNVDAIAGNTSQVDKSLLESWLKPLGTIGWIDSADPLAAFANASARANIGWHLLWITLALVMLEAWLARVFSHANEAGKVGAATMLFQRFVGKQKGDAA